MGFLSDTFKDVFKGSGGDLIGAAVSLGGSLLGANSSSNAAERNYAAQKEFAQNGIRWKVEDAKAAGIHPLAALGAHTASFSPVFQGSDYSGFSNAGQMISRAMEAKQTQAERELADLQVEHARLENEYTRAKIDDLKNQGVHRDFAAVQALDSANAARVQQRQPPMPTIYGPAKKNSSSDLNPVGFIIDPFTGKRTTLSHTSDYFELFEDMPLLEFIPALVGMSTDFIAKVTRAPIFVDGKWYAFNGNDDFVPIDKDKYINPWKNWLKKNAASINARIQADKKRSSTGRIRDMYGG